MKEPRVKTKIRENDMPECEELIKLQRRLEVHIKTCTEDRTVNADRHKKSMEAIEALTATTQGVVEAWVVINGFHRFVKWLSGFAVLGGAIVWIQQTFK